jgi:hypothetical protein
LINQALHNPAINPTRTAATRIIEKSYPPIVPVAEGAPAARTNKTRVATNKTTRMFFEIENAIDFMNSSFFSYLI